MYVGHKADLSEVCPHLFKREVIIANENTQNLVSIILDDG